MIKKAGILSLSAVGVALLLSSCQYDKDPNQEWKDRGKEAYKAFYAKPENQDLEKVPLFYFDIETFKGVLVNDENTATYLGQLNFSNFTFSENPTKYFVDFGNVPIIVNDTNDDGSPDNFTFGDYIYQDESGNTTFDMSNLMNNLPFVLHEFDAGGDALKTYSMVKDGGIIPDTSNAKAYDPNFFYISDFSIKIDGLEEFTSGLLDFRGKDLAFLRNDLYSIIDSLLNQENIANVNEALGLSETLVQTYRKSVQIPFDQNMPDTIKIQSRHYSNFHDSKEVVVGPISFIPQLLEKFLPDIGAKELTPSIYDVETIILDEGIATVSFYAFSGERDPETGASKSNLKNIYLPSTLQNVQFNAFNELDLENLYIPKTYQTDENGVKTEKAFETVDFGDAAFSIGEGEDQIDITVAPSFGNTNITNLYFEDYNNANISKFPYSTTNLADRNIQNQAIKIYHGDYDTTKFDKLSDAFNVYDTVNPFYQLVLQANDDKTKYKVSSDISNIAKGKKLYLPYSQYSLNSDEARGLVTNVSSGEVANSVSENDAKLTLTLENDLTIDGSLIIGSQIGLTKEGSGDILGEFASIDLNGHKITINNGGNLVGNGLIYDSKNSGEVVVKNGGKLFTNITIKDYQDFNQIDARATNGANLFDSYKFNSLKVKTTFETGSKLEASFDYVSSSIVNENKFVFIGNDDNALINLKSGNIVLDTKNKSLNGSGTEVRINNVKLLEIEDVSSVTEDSNEVFNSNVIGFNLSNSELNVNFNKVDLATYLRCETGNLLIHDLNLAEDARIYSKSSENLTLGGSLRTTLNEVSTYKPSVLGEIKVNDSTIFDSVEDFVSGENEANLNYSSSVVSVNDNQIVSEVKTFNIILGANNQEFDKLLFKNQVGYHYVYENSYRNGSLKTDSENSLAHYSENGNWIAENVKDQTGPFQTGLSSSDNRTILDFSTETNTYVLNVQNASWDSISAAENGIYTIGGTKYIRTSPTASLIQGREYQSPSESSKLFISSTDNSLYLRRDYSEGAEADNWIKVESYDGAYVLKESGADNYFALLDGTSYTSGVTYNHEQHLVSTSTSARYIYINGGFAELNQYQIVHMDQNAILDDTKNGYVFINSGNYWTKAEKIGSSLAETSTGTHKYYFKVNGLWLESVDGEYAIETNELAKYSFGVLADRYSYNGQRYKFVMREGDSSTENPENFELFTPQAMVNVNREDFEDLWPDDASRDSLHAYRHIEVNGEKYLFVKNEEGVIERRRFEFASGFTPADPDPDNTNSLTRFNFIIYKVNFYNEDGTLSNDVVTLYVNVDSSDDSNAIYAGSSEVDSEDYLALAVFTSDNPIGTLTSASTTPAE